MLGILARQGCLAFRAVWPLGGMIFLLQLAAFVFAVAGTADFDLDRMMEDAVQDRAGGDRVAEIIRPVLFFDIGGKDQRSVLVVSLVDDLKEQVRFFGHLQLQAVMAHLVNDQQLWFGVLAQTFGQGFFIDAKIQIADQRGAGGIKNAMAFLTSDDGQAPRQMALAGAAVADEENGFVGLEKRQRGQIHACPAAGQG